MKLAYRRKLKMSILKKYFQKFGGMANVLENVVVSYSEFED